MTGSGVAVIRGSPRPAWMLLLPHMDLGVDDLHVALLLEILVPVTTRHIDTGASYAIAGLESRQSRLGELKTGTELPQRQNASRCAASNLESSISWFGVFQPI